MKIYTFLILLLAAACTQCAEEKCTDGDLLPNPADCNSYFECVGGQPIEEKCPPGLHWSDKNKVCDYPENAGCVEISTTEGPSEATTINTEPTVEPTTSGPKPDKCPEIDDPEHDVLLPNPDDCGSFFKCLGGKPYLIKCPEGEEWSIELERCDWPEIAKCSITKFIYNSEECNIEGELLSNPADCSSFFQCVGGQKIKNFCPPGLQWSDTAKVCDYPANAQCKETETESPTVKPTEDEPQEPTTSKPRPDKCPEVDDPEHDVLLPNPDDCGSFFKCFKGKPYLIKCPPGQEWSTELERCDWPEIAKCTITKFVYNSEECNIEGELLSNPADCSSFFQCVGGQKIKNFCPPGLQWSDTAKVCDYPDNAQCKETETESPTVKPTEDEPQEPTTSKPRPDKCPEVDDPEHDVLLPNPDDCGSFFKCFKGKPYLIKCPPGQEWSTELERCDWPEIAKCSTTIKIRASNPECYVEGELFKNPEDCSSFFKCAGGYLVTLDCPPHLEWNDKMKYCDYPINAHCSEGSEENPEKPSTTRNPISDECPALDDPEHAVHFPNPADCTTFFKCSNGEAILMDCPPGQEWAADLDRCDYPEIAKCTETN